MQALNAINSLIRTKPQKARELMIFLADQLRHSLKKPGKQITLDDEMHYIRSYLDIEQVRFGDKLTVEYDIKAPGHTKLPPFTLQPIIENSIKHRIGENFHESQIRISAEVQIDCVYFEVCDNCVGMANRHPKGFFIWLMLFITIDCGAISGFHATQSPIMARCLTNEKHGCKVFYGAMIGEGIIVLALFLFQMPKRVLSHFETTDN